MAVMEVRGAPVPVEQRVGPLGRLGRWAADHLRLVALAWGVVAVVLAIFAPSVETALSGAGWQANGSESVSARSLIEQNFAGLSSSAPMVVLHSPGFTAESPAFRAVVDRVETILRSDRRIQSVQAPRRGATHLGRRPYGNRRRRRARRSDGDGGRRRRPEAEAGRRLRPLTFR